jgi:hypothetical protein
MVWTTLEPPLEDPPVAPPDVVELQAAKTKLPKRPSETVLIRAILASG